MRKESYFTQRDELNITKIREIVEFDLPDFCEEFFMGVENITSPLTRLGYARDLKTFFYFLITEIREFKTLEQVKEFTLADLEKVTSTMIEKFLHFVSYYENGYGQKLRNGEKARARKLSSVRVMLKYFLALPKKQ